VTELQEPVPPGKEGAVTVRFNSNGHPNFQHKDVSVYANTKNKNADIRDVLTFEVDVTPKK